MEEAAMIAVMAAIDAGRGSFVNLLTRCGVRYQGYISRVDSPEFMIALTDVKCFGTEGRRMDGQEYAGNERIYEYIIFRGSEVIELQFLTLPPAQIGFVPNYMPGSIAQTSTTYTLLPMQNPGGTATVFVGPSNFVGLQDAPLLPVGFSSTNLYPPTTHSSSPGQSATLPELSIQMAPQPVSQSFPTPSALGGLLPTPQLGHGQGETGARASQPVSQSFPTPSALGGLLPTPQLGHGQGEAGAVALGGLLPTPQGSSARGRGSVASAQGRGRQVWRRVSER